MHPPLETRWGTLWILGGGRNPDRAGDDRTAFYDRPSGGVVSIAQSNDDQGNGPVTRKGLPLTNDQVVALLRGPAWDRFFRG